MLHEVTDITSTLSHELMLFRCEKTAPQAS
jgi:hypothetical protein